MTARSAMVSRVIALPYLAVVLGLGWGHLVARDPVDPDIWLTYGMAPGAISAALLAVASFRSDRDRSGWWPPALTVYAVLIMRWEPFVEIDDWPDLLIGVGAIRPPLLGCRSLVRSGARLALCGVVLFSATSIVCLTFNVMANPHGWVSGFFDAHRYLECY